MSDVKVTIGANAAPFQQTMAEVKATAERTSAAVGLEGLKGERALKTQLTGFFKDIASGSNFAQAAVGRLGESFKMSAGTLAAFVAVQFLFDTLQKGYESAKKFGAAIQDSLTINTDNSVKSIEQMQEGIEQLKQSAKDTDLGSMSNLEAGSTVFVQALEKCQSISETINEDAREHFDIVQKEHEEQDAAATRSIDQENEILRLRISGNEEAADAARDEYADRNKMLDLQQKGDQDAIDALNEQIKLKEKLRDETKFQKQKETAEGVRKEISAEQDRRAEIGKTPEQKLADAKAKTAADRAAYDNVGMVVNEGQAIDKEKLRLQVEKDITKEKELQADVDTKNSEKNASQAKKNLEIFLRGNETDARVAKEKDAKKREAAKLLDEESSAQAAVMGFHGSVTSLRRIGFGRTTSQSPDGRALKVAQESAKRLANMEKELKALNTKIGGSI